MLTFRTTITAAVMAFIIALAALLIVIQVQTFQAATKAAASAYMDAASAKARDHLQAQVSELASLVRVLSTSSSLADSDQRSETDRAISVFETALVELPQMDSIYVGYDNGCWLQVRRLSDLNDAERESLGAPREAAAFNVNLVQATAGGALPMRRRFVDAQGNLIEQLDLSNYGYDARKRSWYRDTIGARRALVSPPYASFSIGTPVITLSAPLQGRVRGVIAADLKLDNFSDFVNAQRPGKHGTALIFDSSGTLIAHPNFARLAADVMTHPSQQLPKIMEIKGGLIAAVLRGWDGGDRYEGSIRDESGQNYFYRLQKFVLSEQYSGHILLLAAQNDFLQDVQKSQLKALILAIITGGCFVPGAWLFGSRMSRSLKRITSQADRMRTLAVPAHSPITSYVKEIHDLGAMMTDAQRTIWSFAHFVPKEIVKGVMDSSISTELGGVRQELTILFTDVRNFTGIAEAADPDALMRQTSRHFTALTEAFLAEGGTVDKFIGDGVMVFWNAPNPQPDHVERACRAALSAKIASDLLNAQFAAEGLPPFIIGLGIHVGDVVVGNVGSAERMDYTALGSSVNLASRLEGLNKEYGTTILVSQAVRARAQHYFRFKPVGSVIAKGMTQETCIYELAGASAEGSKAQAATPPIGSNLVEASRAEQDCGAPDFVEGAPTCAVTF